MAGPSMILELYRLAMSNVQERLEDEIFRRKIVERERDELQEDLDRAREVRKLPLAFPNASIEHAFHS
jgi:hypothetical protein